MADYLIQDTTLDAIADAINAKTGGSSAMTPAEMATAIESISGGETNFANYAETISFWSSNIRNELPEEMSFHFIYSTNISNAFRNTKGLKKLKISSEKPINIQTFLFDCLDIKEVDLTGTKITTAGAGFQATPLETVIGFDGTYLNGTGLNFNFPATLKNFTAVENSMVYDISFVNSNLLTDDSLVSIVNFLKNDGSSHTLTLHNTSKNRLPNIVGIVSIKTDADSNSYSFFTPDASGTVSLRDFITTEKGWTIA